MTVILAIVNDLQHNIDAISTMVKKEQMDIAIAANIISAYSYQERSSLSERYKEITYAADIVCEDEREGFAKIKSDDYFKNALFHD